MPDARAFGTTPTPMKSELLHVLQHSVGANQYGQYEHGQYRNHFCAGGGDVDLCRELVSMGYMVERPASELTGGDPLFQVTTEGRTAITAHSPKPPKLTRSQLRYREFLRADTGERFGTWLKDRAEWAKQERSA